MAKPKQYRMIHDTKPERVVEDAHEVAQLEYAGYTHAEFEEPAKASKPSATPASTN